MPKVSNPELYVVHCVDAEGPLNETLCATFERLEYIFGIRLESNEDNYKKLKSGEIEGKSEEETIRIRNSFSGSILNYNKNWAQIEQMNEVIFSKEFRMQQVDDFQNPWKITWFCLDHVNFPENPREKALGYSVVLNYYKKLVGDNQIFGDSLQWHYHPKSISQNPVAAASSYSNSMKEILEILSRKVIDDKWFPTTYRPGFHTERQDANLFLEQWFPFDFGNQRFDEELIQNDMQNARFGNWSRAPKSWRGYHPSSTHYDVEGSLNRLIFRCLNLGTRLRLLDESHFEEAFEEAQAKGNSVLAFTDHDFRDIAPDVVRFQSILDATHKKFPEVKIRYCTAEEAAQRITGYLEYEIKLECKLDGNVLQVKELDGEIFGSQPFLALKTKNGVYLHDNFDFDAHNKLWNYTFDEQTFHLDELIEIGIATAGKFGGFFVEKISFIDI